MMDLLVQIVIVATVLVMVILPVVAQDRPAHLREQMLRPLCRRHWWNRIHNGH